MKNNNGNKKAVMKLAACCLMVLAFAGHAMAQSDPLYVIKYEGHYLAHVNNGGTWELQNSDVFNLNCLWYSGNTVDLTGNHHNYYFLDGSNYHFLTAPLAPNQPLGLSNSLPAITLLRNPDQIYYFYDWDSGVARGHEYTGVNNQDQCTAQGGVWHQTSSNPVTYQCWKVYWVEYQSGVWRTSVNSYDPTGNEGKFRQVTVTEHPKEITSEEGGLEAPLNVPDVMVFGAANPTLGATVSLYDYTYYPAYTTYVFEGVTHNYYNNGDQGTHTPGSQTSYNNTATDYLWSISGEGAEYLSFNSGSDVNTSDSHTPVLYYRVNNTTGHKTATITLTVTYSDGSTQSLTHAVLVKTDCHNPLQAADPVITYESVTVSWFRTTENYVVYWKKSTDPETAWNSITVGEVASYAFYGLNYDTNYDYKVAAICTGGELSDATVYHFKTKVQPGLLVYGAVFGGGRMADVTGKTEVAIINGDSIHAVYGGNDIAGTVHNAAGSTITLGVKADDPNNFDEYGTTNAAIRIGDVYGGGNGYYAYNGTSFEAASSEYTSQTVAAGEHMNAMTPDHHVGEAVWTNTSTEPKTWSFPSITKTTITVTNDYIKVDSIFGGAKNAFLTAGSGDGSTIIVNGGTVFAIFGGNNFGGKQGYGKHRIVVNNTTVKTTVSDYNSKLLGRDFGIGYLFGGGNKVYGSTTNIYINGGQIDTIFGGGNAADVYAAKIWLQCAPPTAHITGGGTTYGNIYSNAIDTYYLQSETHNQVSDSIAVKSSYTWDGTGIYNVRTLFGGNNKASMAGVPDIYLTSGGVGTVYGGGNAGDMLAQEPTTLSIPNAISNPNDNVTIKYGTHVEMDSPLILIDNLYGGCQVSNVDYSTWVVLLEGNVGTVYGGCNISGDVGSTKVNTGGSGLEYQEVQGGTYVQAKGGVVHKNLFAGSNGFYHCNNGLVYVEGINYSGTGPQQYVGMLIPTHNETHVILYPGVDDNPAILVKGNVYAGGNMAPVGFTDQTVGDRPYPQFVGWASMRMRDGEVVGNVYGGGNMASIFGSNEVMVSGGKIGMSPGSPEGAALYGGNDRSGQAGQISNRVLPEGYDVASDGQTPLNDVHTYVGVTGKPDINTVYGGGNGYYDYEHGDIEYCTTNDAVDYPIQRNTFVDINITGNNTDGTQGGHINTVYGGGNGVTVAGFLKVFLNVKDPITYDHVDVIYGGNNKGYLELLPDIILLKGQVNTVYGGCNEGAMEGHHNVTIGTDTYENVGSMVRLRSSYDPDGDEGPFAAVTPTAVVSNAVYGGCRLNKVNYNSMVLVEGGTHSDATIFGGCDISGNVDGISSVIVTGGTVGVAYGGSNGNYYYNGNNVYPLDDHEHPIAEGTTEHPIVAPFCTDSRVDMLGGNAGNLYAGGLAATSHVTSMTIDGGTVSGSAFGGGKQAGVETTSTVTMNGGTVLTGLYGGCHESGNITGDVTVNIYGGTAGAAAVGNVNDPDYVPAVLANIHGGGYGQGTGTNANVTVNIGKIVPDMVNEAPILPLIYGDIYGGSALGNVNDANTDITTVNFMNGTLHGNIYGGGLGQKAAAAVIDPVTNEVITPAVEAIAAKVFGKVFVNISSSIENQTEANCYIDLRDANVYGCNNANGSPQDDVTVNVWKTAFNYSDYPEGDNYTSQNGSNVQGTAVYAINQVFGGGNEADYLPENGSTSSTKKTTVHVHECLNTIRRVFGGGNAAFAQGVVTIIEGGRMDYIFGGGNGEVSAANIGAGGAHLMVHAGIINQLYGGSNQSGNILGPIDTDINGSCVGEACQENIAEFFGGSNQADLGTEEHPVTVTTVVECPSGMFGTIYGGCCLADIIGNVNLTIQGGNFTEAYGGSKGSTDDSGAANITGNVTLNLEGGTIVTAYGGSNIRGNITGSITVNVLDREGECPLDVTNIFGASNATAYEPTDPSLVSPVINLIHINNAHMVNETNVTYGVRGNVFGGGNLATVTANPQVNIGYDETTMSGLIPSDYPQASALTNYPQAYVTGDVFGGGNQGAVTGNTVVNFRHSHSHADEIFGGGNDIATGGVSQTTTVNIVDGTVATAVYGGCNTQGTVAGDIAVNVTGGTLGTSSSDEIQIFGGGYGPSTATSGNVTVTLGTEGTGGNIPIAPIIYGTVYGGSALGSVNDNTDDLTKVWLKSGTVNGRVYGGGLGQKNGVGGATSDIAAHVNGNIQVVGDGTIVTTCVYGGNDKNGDPEGTITVTVNAGSLGNVVGGGNLAAYSAPSGSLDYPYVNITGGTVINRVVGGGNAANVTGNPRVSVSGGSIGTDTNATTGEGKGIYGGCNDNGTVTGNTTVTLTGGTVGVSGTNTANIHGGGYGEPTRVTGNVHVIFGDNTNVVKAFPKLFGDLYGGSALGDVNTNASNNTTVDVLNGTIEGNVFGGGLGRKEATGVTAVEAKVNGVVQVNIGKDIPGANPTTIGQATLINCDIFGCNNQNGSPQDVVHVDVYQTAHLDNATINNTVDGEDFAIHQVFGGGNEAHYDHTGKRTYVFIHHCTNTIERMFGGGNAADVWGIDLSFDGGRFGDVFGGGNGEVSAANVTGGGIDIHQGGGEIGSYFDGSNLQGEVIGGIRSGTYDGCGTMVVVDYYLGGNQTDVIGDLTKVITCADASNWKYVNFYGGCRFAQVYGNINVTIKGGTFENVFGGSKGSQAVASSIHDYTEEYINGGHGVQAGDGGNITLTINGGTIGNLYGGCDINGNVENKITITVEHTADGCDLFIGNIYGGGNLTPYHPTLVNQSTTCSPEVNVINATIGGDVDFDGSGPREPVHYEGNVFGGGNIGKVTSNPKVTIGGTSAGQEAKILGDVFGGGNTADLEGNTKVILQGKASVIGQTVGTGTNAHREGGDVYGGGKQGDVTGSTEVIIVPTE